MSDQITLLMVKAYSRVGALRNREEGQALVEYALILALIAVVSITVLTTLGTNVAAKLGDIATAIGNA